MIAATDQTLADLVAIVGAAQVSSDESSVAPLSAGGKTPRAAVYPTSAEEVAAVLRYSSEHGLAVIPCRNATKLMMGNLPGRYDVALSLKNLNRVWHFEPADLTISVEPGMTLLVKPVNTQDLLRQIEALLISHEDHKKQTAGAPVKNQRTRADEALRFGRAGLSVRDQQLPSVVTGRTCCHS